MADDIMLNYLGQSYFHEDYDLDAPTPGALVEKFARDEDGDYVQILVDELQPILASGIEEWEARHMWLRDAHARYDPARDGKLYIDWLNEVVAIVERVLTERRRNGEEW